MAALEPGPYVGRFAPSPTGPLHFGSLLAAVASYLQARSRSGRWHVRVEDIDPPRQQEGAIGEILTALERYGFEWDGPVTFQSDNADRHRRVVADLQAAGNAYPCSCARRDLASARRGPLGSIYPGTCRDGCKGDALAIRVRTSNAPVGFVDGLQGPQCQQLESESGDFVIRRRDGLIAYHLAMVVDDFDDGMTEIVRGIDLLDSTPRQIYLQRLLDFQTPAYLHIPVAENADGQKLSKQTGAPAISLDRVNQTVVDALEALGQQPPADLAAGSLDDVWAWSIEHWNPGALVGRTAITAAEGALAWGENGLS
ncbi:MAG: tRNA glutamyl-Q(34) synthetase GluQRS [Woeseia sp.]